VAEPSDIPPYSDYLWSTLRAVREIGESGTIEEIVARVVSLEGISSEQLAVLHGNGPQREVEYRLSWCRSHLKGMGLLENSRRGIWSTTERGRSVHAEEIPELHAAYRAQRRELQRTIKAARAVGDLEDSDGEDPDESSTSWKEELLTVLQRIEPDEFERLSRRLLREAGFVSATVTGKTGDGGIDGVGVYRLSLVSFPVFFQCKRYVGSVGAGAVRDFRGAMSGRGDKGLLLTTGTFTAEAKQEATRDGAPAIDLIDGDRLCDLLKEYELGVRRTIREVEEITVDAPFFSDL
jgi:restriction system protein